MPIYKYRIKFFSESTGGLLMTKNVFASTPREAENKLRDGWRSNVTEIIETRNEAIAYKPMRRTIK